MSIERALFAERLKNINRRLKEKRGERDKLEREERKQILEIRKRFDRKKDVIRKEEREIERELYSLQEDCPNFSEHTEAIKKNRRSGEGFVCRICRYKVHESDERL